MYLVAGSPPPQSQKTAFHRPLAYLLDPITLITELFKKVYADDLTEFLQHESLPTDTQADCLSCIFSFSGNNFT